MMKYRDVKENEYIKFSTARDYLHTACSGLGSNGGLMLKIRFEEEKTVEHNEWIPCSKRLPELNRSVIFSTKDWTGEGCITKTTEDGHVEWVGFRWDTFYWDDDIIAWMPLPEPYKEN